MNKTGTSYLLQKEIVTSGNISNSQQNIRVNMDKFSH